MVRGREICTILRKHVVKRQGLPGLGITRTGGQKMDIWVMKLALGGTVVLAYRQTAL